MSDKASLWLRGFIVLGCAVAVIAWSGPASWAEPGKEQQPAALSLEDLQDALDRGELSQWEFDIVAAMVQERLKADSLELARLSERLQRAPDSERGAGQAAARGQVRYSVYAPVRGSGSAGQDLQAQTGFGGCSAQAFARRSGSGPWYVTRATLRAESGPFTVEGGSLELVWTGGLVVGRSPVFIDHFGSGIASLWKPDRSRLWGARVGVTAGPIAAELLGSSVSDSLLQHRAGGLKLRVDLGGLWLEPAWVGQRLSRRGMPGAYASQVGGVTAGFANASGIFELNSAVAGRDLALQVHAAGHSTLLRWETSYWAIPPGFRQPLLQARGETDRESVFYPELGASLESASTGESGGRFSLRTGGSRTFGGVTASVWREQPFRPASLRLAASAQKARGVGVVRLDYAHTTRPDGEQREGRHEAGVLTKFRGVFAEVRGMWTWGNGLPFGAAGGRLAGGVRVHSAGAGVWEAKASWDSYDLSLASRQFVTLRVDQSLPFRRGELAVHVRWRSAYGSHAAVLSLRIDSSVYL